MTTESPAENLARYERLPEVGDMRDGYPVVAVDREKLEYWIAPRIGADRRVWWRQAQQ